MTDIRRTLLWGIFLASLFFLWESWNRHNGQPSLFGPPPRVAMASPASPASPGTAPSNSLPATAAAPVAAAAAGAPASAVAAAPTATGERVTVTTDLVRATFDTKGADVVGLVLLDQQEHAEEPWYASFLKLFGAAGPAPQTHNVTLFDPSPDHFYVAQTGLWPAATGPGALPEHHTVMTLVSGERALKDGANELQLRFESPELAGVKLVKTYTFHRGSFAIDVRHEIVNASGASISPYLYLQFLRGGYSAPGGSGFYSTFTGPAIYTDTKHYEKIDFKAIDKREDANKILREPAPSGWVAMVQHYFMSAWLLDKAAAPASPWEFFTGKVDANTYSVGMLVPVGQIAAGTSRAVDAKLFAGPAGRRQAVGDGAGPRAGQGLRLFQDTRRAAVLAADAAAQDPRQLGLVDRRPGRDPEDRLLLAQRQGLRLDGEDEGDQSAHHGNARAPEGQAAADAAGDDAHLPRGEGQPARRLPADRRADAVLHRPLLGAAVDGRDENAPWIGWITDLSAKDPYFILPLLMTCTSLLQTWLNPTPPDPVQARMMWIMPLVFSVMFFFFPAGLVLYWLTNNILSIAQQYLINKRLGVLGK